ncbi:MAG: ORF6N domain-containing protein [Bacteroidales bacterium]|nr:ORF6N domain-containing protein [Bacteroidales bacterium]
MKDKDNSAELSANDGFMPNIYIIRGLQVMMDYDLAAIYGYETRRFNEQIKNNIERFDEDFRFQLTELEFKNLMPKFSTSSWGGVRYLPAGQPCGFMSGNMCFYISFSKVITSTIRQFFIFLITRRS